MQDPTEYPPPELIKLTSELNPTCFTLWMNVFHSVFLKLQITTQKEVRDSVSGGSTPQKGNRFVSISLHPRERNHFPLIWVPG